MITSHASLLRNLTIAALFLTLAAHAEENRVPMNGVVIDFHQDMPVPGAKVYPREQALEPEKWTTTDENGRFTLYVDQNDMRRPGGAMIYARTWDGSQIGAAMHAIDFPYEKMDEEYVMIPLHKATFVTGTVVDADGNPVAGATVESGNDDFFARTNKKGEFKILLPDRGGILFAYHEDFGVDFAGFTQQASPENPIYGRAFRHGELVNQRAPVRLTLRQAKPVKIRVVTDTGVPLPGVWVGPKEVELTKEDEQRHGIDSSLIDDTFDALIPPEFSLPKEGAITQFPWSWYGVTDADGTVVFDKISEAMLENTRFTVGIMGPRRDGLPMPDGTRYFPAYSERAWNEMDASDDVRTYTVPRAGCLIVNVKLPDGTPAPHLPFWFAPVKEWLPFQTSYLFADEDGKIWVFDELPACISMYAEGDSGLYAGKVSWEGFPEPLLKDIDLGDGSQAVEVDYVYDGILLHGNIYLPDGDVSEKPSMRFFQCGNGAMISRNGEYRCVLPREAGKIKITLQEDLLLMPSDEEFEETLDVTGDEKVIRFDIRLKRKTEPQS